MDNTHEWVAEGISSERLSLQHLPTTTHFPLLMRELRLHGAITVNSVDDLPAEASLERAEFEREGIRSLVCVAMLQDGELAGFLGLDSVERERHWTSDEVALLRLVGETLMGAIARKRSEEALLRSEKLRSVGVLAGGIAHDFNNILTAILGNITLMQTVLSGDEQGASTWARSRRPASAHAS